MHLKKGPHDDALIVFGRYPVPGQTKTRLIPALGPVGAAELQRRLAERTIQTARAFASISGVEVKVVFDGGSRERIRRWLGGGLSFSQQVPGDLGKRIHTAFREGFREGGRRVVLLGTDIPEANTRHLGQAFDVLHRKDLVLGPSRDGGYWLMGLRRPANLFQGIEWGTEKVLDQTVALAKKEGLRFHLIDQLTDIDTESDLASWRPQGKKPGPYLSVIIPALNEAPHIGETIERARDRDAEIIVVDGGSTDKTADQARSAGVRLETATRGRAIQQNRGAASARGRVLLFLHADTLLPGGYVNHVFDVMMDPLTAAGAFRFRTDLDGPAMKAVELLTNVRSRYLKIPYGDQGLFVRKSLFDAVGGVPHVPIAEDLFFVRRLSRQGTIRIAPADAITSARRWRRLGVVRTTLINQLILLGCYLRVSPHRLAPLYRITRKR